MQPLRINFLMNQVLLQTANDVAHVTQRFRSKVQIDLLRDWSRLAASVCFFRKKVLQDNWIKEPLPLLDHHFIFNVPTFYDL